MLVNLLVGANVSARAPPVSVILNPPNSPIAAEFHARTGHSQAVHPSSREDFHGRICIPC
jgi:hypothetical protein